MFAESLTVRILADSSSFRTDLDAALSLLGRLRDSAQAVADGGSAIGNSFSQLSRVAAPLQQISKLLSGIQNQLRTISQTPLAINVDMAMASLAQLSGMIDTVSAKLNALSSARTGGGLGPAAQGGGPAGNMSPMSLGGAVPLPPKLSTTMSVLAPSVDSRPAPGQSMPSPAAATQSGGWAVLAAAMERLGHSPQLPPRDATLPAPSTVNVHANTSTGDSWPLPMPMRSTQSAGSATPVVGEGARPRDPSASRAPTSATTNNFGGITINVRETADVNGLMRDLRLQGVHLRNRRG